jgi:hypothetical protein
MTQKWITTPSKDSPGFYQHRSLQQLAGSQPLRPAANILAGRGRPIDSGLGETQGPAPKRKNPNTEKERLR